MAFKGMELGLAMVVLVGMLLGEVTAQSSCSTAITSLAPCLNYITGNSSTPSSSCCSQLSNVVQSSPQCLCSVLNNGGSVSLGITINQTLALSLPGACKVRTPPIAQCQAANGPTASPAPSGSLSPPADSSDGSPEGAITPSASDIPSAGGSKTIPSTEGNSSDGSIVKAPLHFLLFFFFILTFASATLSN
ncbi:non-specific lipid transfer protein GPI-anchored 5 [Ziziphus jujuba]|uniref:Non-specific lipid transfer protein GPI-anchored 5 n=1 Tax=Ziziphus jujuba TaxID=326968 RepID=A0A6P4ABK6_ZIZJJ|nr:non-specific lipid transfer protein GPI-anchored 5 [Ziziphus jujuba]